MGLQSIGATIVETNRFNSGNSHTKFKYLNANYSSDMSVSWDSRNLTFIKAAEEALINATGLNTIIVDLIIAVVIIGVSLILARGSKLFINEIGHRLANKTSTSLDDEIMKAVNGPLQALIVVFGIYVSLQTLTYLPFGIYENLNMLLLVAIIIVGAYQVANIVKALLNWYKNDIAPKTDSEFDDIIIPFISKLSTAAIIVLAFMMIIDQFIDITPLIASFGIVGIAVALAAQELLSNLFGALAILTDRPYKIGDRIQLSSGEMGDVIEIGLRSTKLMTLERQVIVVPNSEISKSRIVNYSMPDTTIRFTLKVGVAYGTDIKKATSVMLDIADKTEGVLKQPNPKVYITGLGDYTVNLRFDVWAQNYKLVYDIPDRLYRQILKSFREEGIVIPYPIKTVIMDTEKKETPGVTIEVVKTPGLTPR